MEKERKNNKTLDWIIKIILIIVIIILLIHNCALVNKNKNDNDGQTDIIEINCDHNGCDSKQKKIESISFAEDTISIKKGDTLNLIVIIKPSELSSSSKLTWKSSNPNIVTVDDNGNITAIKNGKATITVTSDDGKKAKCTINVTDNDVEVEEIILTPLEETISIGNVTQIITEIKPKNATNRYFIWKSSNNEIATVDQNGVVTAISSGTVTITVETEDGKVVASVTLTIVEEDTGEFEVYGDNHTPITWNGSNNLNIFGTSGKIAPESSNTYQFIIKNTTKYNLSYTIKLIETNPYNINMKYKLKRNDTYLIDQYVSVDEIDISKLLLNSKQNDNYSLEWKWISSDNDTQIGKTANVNYGLKIEIKAESTND